MKPPIILSILGAAALLLAGCQGNPPPNNFSQTTHRTYNPQTHSFEQSPPWGKQSNKTDDSTGQ